MTAKKTRRSMSLEDRLKRKLSQPTASGCILWLGSRNRKVCGYGIISTGNNPQRFTVVHRVAYTLWVGPIPQGMCVCHRCDNPICVNVAHLFLGTHEDNMNDKIAKGRQAKGRSFATTKLTPTDVVAIRRRFAEGGVTKSQLAQEYGITWTNLAKIINRTHWNHVQ